MHIYLWVMLKNAVDIYGRNTVKVQSLFYTAC